MTWCGGWSSELVDECKTKRQMVEVDSGLKSRKKMYYVQNKQTNVQTNILITNYFTPCDTAKK